MLATLTRNNATFTERDLDRHLAKHIADAGGAGRDEGGGAGARRDVLPLHDRETGEAAGRFTTRTVRAQERDGAGRRGTLARRAGTAVCRPGSDRGRAGRAGLAAGPAGGLRRTRSAPGG